MAEISDEDYLAQHPEHSGLDPAIRAQLRQNAQLQADLDSRSNELAAERLARVVAEARFPDVPELELFLNSYKGDMTVDAMREAAAKYPALNVAGTVADNAADLDGHLRIQQGGAGAPAAGAIDFGDALDRVRSNEEWFAVMANAPDGTNLRLTRTAPDGSRII